MMKRRSSPRRDERHRAERRRHDEASRHSTRDRSPRKRDPKGSFLSDTQIKNEPEPEWGKSASRSDGKSQEKEKPNFSLSGKLTEDVNMVNGVVIKYSEPADSRRPNRRWRLYPFKGEKALPVMHIHRQSAFLLGRDRKVADIGLDHPSCSKQHAALQYRLVPFKRDNGTEGKRVRPYLIDLESANGTYINNVKLEPRKYHELIERDVIKFGCSSREYVLLHEHSKDEAMDDDFELPVVSDV